MSPVVLAVTPAEGHADEDRVRVASPRKPDGPGKRTRSQTSECRSGVSSSIVTADEDIIHSRGTKRKMGSHDCASPPSSSTPTTRGAGRRGAGDPRRKQPRLEGGATPLPLTLAAARDGEEEALAALLKQGAGGMDDAIDGEESPLIDAISRGQEAVVVALIRAGVDVGKVHSSPPWIFLTLNPSTLNARSLNP